MSETELSRIAGLCPQKPGSSFSYPSLEAQDFYHRILQVILFGLQDSLPITFVNIAFFFHMFLSKANLECTLGGTTISQQRHSSKPRDFCFIIKVSEKITASFRKKLPTDSSSVKRGLLFIPAQSSQAPKLFTWNTWALTSVPGTMGSFCLQDGQWGGTKKDWSIFAVLYAWPGWDGIVHVPRGRGMDGARMGQNVPHTHTPWRSRDYLLQQIRCKP